MIKCEICGQKFKNNLGGDLTKHLKTEHNLTVEDYYIITKLNGVEPKCQCGLCNEKPFFNRGKFSKYALGHNAFKWQEKKYVEKYGQPKCQNPECDNNVNFYRGKPRQYCSSKCQPNKWNQEKVQQTVKKKYGVSNVFQLEETKDKSKITNLKKRNVEHHMQSKKIIEKREKLFFAKYGVKSPMHVKKFKNKQKETFLKKYGVTHYSKTKKFREIASQNMCNYNQNIKTNHKIRKYKNTDLYYQSMYEYRFLEYCENNQLLKYITNSPTFKYLNLSFGKWHIPDFKFKNKFIIEIKSTYWLEKQGGWDVINEKQKSVEIKGYKYIFILDENYNNFLKIL